MSDGLSEMSCLSRTIRKTASCIPDCPPSPVPSQLTRECVCVTGSQVENTVWFWFVVGSLQSVARLLRAHCEAEPGSESRGTPDLERHKQKQLLNPTLLEIYLKQTSHRTKVPG